MFDKIDPLLYPSFTDAVDHSRFLWSSYRHDEYREFLLNHILKITIMHWDSSMRELGSQAAARVIELDLETLGPQSLEQLKKNCKSRDSNTLHGTLLTSAELAKVAGTSGNLELQVQVSRKLCDRLLFRRIAFNLTLFSPHFSRSVLQSIRSGPSSLSPRIGSSSSFGSCLSTGSQQRLVCRLDLYAFFQGSVGQFGQHF